MSATLLSDVIHVAEEMKARLDDRARATSRALGCEVPRSAVVRAAVNAWLEDAERRPLDVVNQAIRAEAQRPAVRHQRRSQRWTEALDLRLDRFADRATRALGIKVTRSAIVRVAVAFWLDASPASPDLVSEAIRAALVARGRRAPR